MEAGLLPKLDSALTELEALEKRLESDQISDSKHWPSLSLAFRKLVSTSIELTGMPETKNRTNRTHYISFCARLKATALVFSETINARDSRASSSHAGPNASKNLRSSSKPPSLGRIAAASISAAKETDALFLPELRTSFYLIFHTYSCISSPPSIFFTHFPSYPILFILHSTFYISFEDHYDDPKFWSPIFIPKIA